MGKPINHPFKAVGAVCAAAIVMVLALGSLAQPKGPYKPGDVVHFVLHDATGKSMSLSQFKNKIIVLDFYGYY
ncbi:MAG TPA: hypothetical protein VKV29_13190 [Chthonomonas sp.]|jgi:hypothetical protein|uniref:hypothetical protein n=1 Tax=Chthonomonas sp. TaxID=2282153 RepID=UPI002B4AD19E|nr:hypothetical protein [Chthonomonas sp.]HLH81223.1 hypothetical protein [Chthonomonas sp.]